MTADALQLLAGNLSFWAAGFGVLALVGRPRTAADVIRHPAMAYMVGVASVGVAATLLLVAGASLALWEILVLTGALASCVVVARRRGGGPGVGQIDRRTALWPALLVGAFLVLLGVDLAFQPLWAYDAWAQWAPKAKSIVLFGGLDGRYFKTAPNSDYPVLVPALEAMDFRFMGGYGTQVLHLQFWLLVVGYAGALYELLRGRVRPLLLWSLVATVVVAPSLGIQAAYAIADVPLAVFFALSGVCAWMWLEEGDREALVLLGIFSAAALATKSEALLFVGSLFLLLIPLAALRSWRLGAATAGVGLVSLVGILPWRIWGWSHGLTNYYAGSSLRLDRIGRVPIAAARLAREALDPTSWLALLPFALAALVIAFLYAGSRRGAALLAGTVALSYVGLVLVYWSTSLPFDYDLDTSSRRVVTAPVLFAAALAPLLLEEALRGARRARASGRSSA